MIPFFGPPFSITDLDVFPFFSFLLHFFLLQDASKRRTTQRRGLPTGVPGPMYLGTGGTVRDAWRDVTRRDKRIEDRLADGTKPDQILEFHTSMSYVRSAEISFFANNIDLTSPCAAKFFRIWPLLLSLSLSLLTCHIEAVCFMLCLAPPSLVDNHTEKAWRTRQPRKQAGR